MADQGVFRLGAVAAFLHVSLSSSADVSLYPHPSLLLDFSPSISISCSWSPDGVVRLDPGRFPHVLSSDAAALFLSLRTVLVNYFSDPYKC